MSLSPNKQMIVRAIVDELNKERLLYERIANQARLDAIDGEMKQEGKYDTRAIEAGYLAGAQKRRLEEIIFQIQSLTSLPTVRLNQDSHIEIGSVVNVKTAKGQSEWIFITPQTGGLCLEVQSIKVHIVSAVAPLAKCLFGLSAGDDLGSEAPGLLKGAQIEVVV